ncbi:MAG TPA: AMP-dependent synthetase, partial [Nitrospiraceae bacterium]|nr:AMP-dependent synthetase [Nitrospiraceae bacterium]
MTFLDELEMFGSVVAVIDQHDNRYSYRDLMLLTERFAEKVDFSKKKIILILCENNIESFIAYLATLRADSVAMLVDAGIDESLLDNLIRTYAPHYIWRPKEGANNWFYQFGRYILTKQGDEGNLPLHRDLSLLLSTSGTTGSSKLVRLTKANLHSNARSISAYLKLCQGQKPITLLPMHYSYGLSVINSHRSVGATILLTTASLMTRPFWDFFRAKGATSFAGVPYTFEMLKKL